MKLHILSDLHLDFAALEPPRTDADVVVLAGDIGRPRDAVAWASGFGKPVLMVAGNHEFYGSSLGAAAAELARAAEGSPVHLLDQRELVLGGVRFLGTTLWTDYGLFADPALRAAAIDEARRRLRDFSRIRLDDADPTPFNPEHAIALFRQQSAWLASRLAQRHPGPTVVVTHHAPSPRSIHPRFAGSLLNAGFASDTRGLLGAQRVALWIHGHTHDSFDYRADGTRVVCNPRGYHRAGVDENPAFDPQLVIDIGKAPVPAIA
ncbi:metallophosphoesterase [Piscinibacter sakaiensis]|uniref:metallophosphoesterase n=1 Tax=Piscinibacter sakaiensis TaxID=1547922 RepID=UPI003AAE4EB6